MTKSNVLVPVNNKLAIASPDSAATTTGMPVCNIPHTACNDAAIIITAQNAAKHVSAGSNLGGAIAIK